MDYGGYSEILYPGYALYLLQQEADNTYTGRNPDATIDAVLKTWIKANVVNPVEYLQDLTAAMQKRNCMAGLLARLNLACLTPMTRSTTTICHGDETIFVNQHTNPLDHLPGTATAAVEDLCGRIGIPYFGRPNQAAERLEILLAGYDLEQIMLVRIGYLVAHARLSEAGSGTTAVAEDRMLPGRLLD